MAGENGSKEEERWKDGRKERDREVYLEMCVCEGGGGALKVSHADTLLHTKHTHTQHP